MGRQRPVVTIRGFPRRQHAMLSRAAEIGQQRSLALRVHYRAIEPVPYESRYF
jgi:hypothetical protein